MAAYVLSNDFGPLRGLHNRGQYGTSIPSKFISADGKTLMLQSNVCCGGDSYTFSLRKLNLELPLAAYPTNVSSNANLALAPGTRAISKSTRFGSLCGRDCSDQLNSGVLNISEDDYDEETKQTGWWGYKWPQPYTFDEVVYQTGGIFTDGGWFAANLQVQVLQNSQTLLQELIGFFFGVDTAGVRRVEVVEPKRIPMPDLERVRKLKGFLCDLLSDDRGD